MKPRDKELPCGKKVLCSIGQIRQYQLNNYISYFRGFSQINLGIKYGWHVWSAHAVDYKVTKLQLFLYLQVHALWSKGCPGQGVGWNHKEILHMATKRDRDQERGLLLFMSLLQIQLSMWREAWKGWGKPFCFPTQVWRNNLLVWNICLQGAWAATNGVAVACKESMQKQLANFIASKFQGKVSTFVKNNLMCIHHSDPQQISKLRHGLAKMHNLAWIA